MANQALVESVKAILAKGKQNDWAGSYGGYRDLFASAEFATYRPEDQRSALKLMLLAKGTPKPPPPAMKEAHVAALGPLTELVSTLCDPQDHELLGVCHVFLGNEESAMAIFRAGLVIAREKNPNSDMCGTLLRRVSML